MFSIDEGENIVYEARKHPFPFYAKLFGLGIVVLILPVLIHLALSFMYEIIPARIGWVGVFSYLIILGLVWMYFFTAWTTYFLDSIIITDKRVIDFELIGMFSRDVATTSLGNVSDITVKVVGAMHTFLKIGQIKIQTPGEEREFIINNIRDPEKVKAQIMEQVNKYKMAHPTVVNIAQNISNSSNPANPTSSSQTIETTPEPNQTQLG